MGIREYAGNKKMSTTKLPVRLYGTRFCPYCIRARLLLSRKGIEYENISVSGNPEKRAEMTRLSGGTTVPQIFIGDQPIGGYDDMAALNKQGELDKLLGLE